MRLLIKKVVKKLSKKKIKLLFRQAMVQADYHTLELLVRFQEPQ